MGAPLFPDLSCEEDRRAPEQSLQIGIAYLWKALPSPHPTDPTCPQQKCLLHVMRDLHEAVLEYPELQQIVASFADLLKSIVQTIDHRGLKRRFLSKHVAGVSRFYREMSKITYNTEVSRKWRDRFEKNRDKLFTFLTYDGVPWNNNNAEHGNKSFCKTASPYRGLSSPKGIEEYLILLSVCQTCRYSGVDFLDFLRSGQKDINAFAGFKGTIDVYTGIV